MDDPVKLLWNEIAAELEATRLAVQREINAYPPPIPACDAHFNYLLERRALIADTLVSARAGAENGKPARDLEHFLATCDYLDNSVRESFAGRLNALRQLSA